MTYYVLLEDVQGATVVQGGAGFYPRYFSILEEVGVEYDDLVYGHDPLSHIIDLHPATKGGLTRFLYEIVLAMEIRDRARSVNSVDVASF